LRQAKRLRICNNFSANHFGLGRAWLMFGRETKGATEHPHFSSALSGVAAPSLSDHDALSLTVWTECETSRKLSGFISAAEKHSQGATLEGVIWAYAESSI
jgi:hypothetical protein